MKKIIILFITLFMFVASPVSASGYDDNISINIQYKLEKDNKKNEEVSGSLAFWGMLAVAFLAISVFIIAYKSDDGTPDD